MAMASMMVAKDSELAVDPDHFDGPLETALRTFQRRHGLEPDGVLGAATATALSVPAAGRLTQIRAPLERWRWVSPELGPRQILVNVAGFRAAVVESGRAAWLGEGEPSGNPPPLEDVARAAARVRALFANA